MNLLSDQLRLKLESPLCANLHSVTDGEGLISSLSDKHVNTLFPFKHTLRVAQLNISANHSHADIQIG